MGVSICVSPLLQQASHTTLLITSRYTRTLRHHSCTSQNRQTSDSSHIIWVYDVSTVLLQQAVYTTAGVQLRASSLDTTYHTPRAIIPEVQLILDCRHRTCPRTRTPLGRDSRDTHEHYSSYVHTHLHTTVSSSLHA